MIGKIALRGIGAVLLLSLAGCASMISGTSESVQVSTVPAGAVCVLERGGLVVGQVYAPGSVTVKKSKDPINVHCNKEGYYETDQVCNVGACGWVAGNIVWGLIGAPIGVITDVSTGAVNDYDDSVTVVLQPKPTDQAALTAESGAHVAHYPHITTK